MRSTSALAAGVIAALLLAACAMTQPESKADLALSSSTALVMFGVNMQSGLQNPALTFRKYDPSTGRVDPSSLVNATRWRGDLTKSQRNPAGQQSLSAEHSYFALHLPPGHWFLWAIAGFYSDGEGNSYSATSFPSEGTIAFTTEPGVVMYVGEYMVSGKPGENLMLTMLPPDLNTAKAKFDASTGAQRELVPTQPLKTRFTCAGKRTTTGQFECKAASIVVGK